MNRPKYLTIAPARETLVTGLSLEKGVYVTERQNAGAYLNQSQGLELSRFDSRYTPARENPIEDGETVLFIRPGGFGDLLFCTPAFRELSRRGCKVLVSCFPAYRGVLEANADVSEILPYPLPHSDWLRADKHVWLERILEDGVDSPSETLTANAIDLVAKAAGMELSDRSMRYDITESEAVWAEKAYPSTGQPRVGIQLRASAVNRSYPGGHTQILIGLLAAEGFEVMVFGEPGLLKDASGPFVNLTANNLDFRQSCAVVGTCEAMVTPDSSLCHVAGALGIPTVALYGPFLSQTRTSHATSIHAINGAAPCAPCFFHDNIGVPWPVGCPGWRTGQCAALANIPPALISAKVAHLIAAAESV